MVSVTVRGLTKRFGETIAVSNADFDVMEGEFLTLLGPSGCGKTTILRCISGLENPDSGEIYFDNEIVNDMPPHKRGVGMVFQNYALWPHLSVFDNVAFGLQLRAVKWRKIRERVNNVLKLVELEGLEKRPPGKLSGGQQQRVALARALVIEPRLLLLDEPLSNLDAKLRLEMRSEIRKIQKKLRITTIYVTHDQEEALSISDKITVLKEGKVQQIGTPLEVYDQPKNEFVADFMGGTNLIHGTVMDILPKKNIAVIKSDLGIMNSSIFEGSVEKGKHILLVIRPETINIYKKGHTPKESNAVSAEVVFRTYLGKVTRYEVKTEAGKRLIVEQPTLYSGSLFRNDEEVILGFDEKAVRLIL